MKWIGNCVRSVGKNLIGPFSKSAVDPAVRYVAACLKSVRYLNGYGFLKSLSVHDSEAQELNICQYPNLLTRLVDKDRYVLARR